MNRIVHTALIAAVMGLAACASQPTNYSIQNAEVVDENSPRGQWIKGEHETMSGEMIIANGKRLIALGEKDIRDGEYIVGGQVAVMTAAERKAEAIETMRELQLTVKTQHDPMSDVEHGKRLIERGRSSIAEGQRQIIEGQQLMERGSQRMRYAEGRVRS